MNFIPFKILTTPQKKAIYELWNNEYPASLHHEILSDFDNYLNKLTDQSHILMVDGNGIIRGWFVDFIRENKKWFAMILDASVQGKGFGTALLNQAKQKEQELNGWVIDHNNAKKLTGEFYQSPVDFYKKNGFYILTDTRLENKIISAVKIRWRK
jgi:GNAT superfamily N-acetyltransferase